MTRKQKKHLRNLILLLIIVSLPLLAVVTNFYVQSFVNPNTNTATFSKIARISSNLNTVLKKATKSDRKINKTSKIMYTQGIGQSFVKGNIYAPQYDYVVGVNLGRYRYDGTNQQNIANNVYQSIIEMQRQIGEEAKESGFYVFVGAPSRTTNADTTALATSIKNTESGQDYVIKNAYTNYTMHSDEVLLPNYKPVILYTNNLKLSKEYYSRLRKITVYDEYYFDLVNLKTKKTTRLFVVPAGIKYPDKNLVEGVYTGIKATRQASKYKLTDEQYLNKIMRTYSALYVNPTNMTTSVDYSPVDVVVRVLQCANLLESSIPRYIVSEIRKNSTDILQNQSLSLLNDYYYGIEMLNEIATSQQTYNALKESGELNKLVKSMEHILMGIINDKNITIDDVRPLFPFQKEIAVAQADYSMFKNAMSSNADITKKYLHQVISNKIALRDKYIVYSIYMDKLLENGGIHHIKLEQQGDSVNVLGDKYTSRIPAAEYSKMTVYNRDNSNVFTQYTWVKVVGRIGATHDYWVKYHPSEMEEVTLKDIKRYLIKNKSRYRLRFRAGFMR